MQLSDGRMIEYAEYGDPNGFPYLCFHGSVGSHYQFTLGHAAAKKYGIRLIAPNREGIGRSDPAQYNWVTDSVEDMRGLMQHLGIEQFGVLGVSGGSACALAVARALPQNVQAAFIVSGLPPLHLSDLLKTVCTRNRRVVQLSCTLPFLVRFFFWLKKREFQKDPHLYIERMVPGLIPADMKMFERKEVRQALFGDLSDMFLGKGGARSFAEAMKLYAYWGFDPKEFPAHIPLHFYHGEDDTVVAASNSIYMGSVIEHAEVTIMPGGHFVIVDAMDEITSKASMLVKKTEEADAPKRVESVCSA